jgi:hypothetical protein
MIHSARISPLPLVLLLLSLPPRNDPKNNRRGRPNRGYNNPNEIRRTQPRTRRRGIRGVVGGGRGRRFDDDGVVNGG